MKQLRWIAAVVLVTCVALVAPLAAQGSIQPGATAASNPNYAGWGSIRDGRCDYSQDWSCFDSSYVTAWHWTGRSWSQQNRAVGQRVYVYPYVKGWTWTWTWSSGSGWLAVRPSDVATG